MATALEKLPGRRAEHAGKGKDGGTGEAHRGLTSVVSSGSKAVKPSDRQASVVGRGAAGPRLANPMDQPYMFSPPPMGSVSAQTNVRPGPMSSAGLTGRGTAVCRRSR